MAMASKSWLVALMVVLAGAPNLAAAHDGGHGPPPHAHNPHHHTGELSIANDFDGKGEVWIDGRFMGVIEGHGQQRFTTSAGPHDVSVRRPGTNFVMLSRAVRVYDDSLVVLRVASPAGTLRVANDGEVALKLDIDHAQVWIAPGSAVQVPVETGNVEIHASVKEPRGEWIAVERTVWVEPGRPETTTLRPDPTVIVISNRENFAVHALFDGDDAGWVAPGETRRVWVRPGPTRVMVLDRNGRVRTTAQLSVQKGAEARVIVQPAFQVTNTVVTTGPVRPGGHDGHGPGRPGGYWEDHPNHDGHSNCPHR